MHKRNAQNNKDSFHKKSGRGPNAQREHGNLFFFFLVFFPLFQSSVPQPPNDPRAVVAMAAIRPCRSLYLEGRRSSLPNPRSCGLKIMGGAPATYPTHFPFLQGSPFPTTFFSPAPWTLMWVESRKTGSWAGCLKAGGLSDLKIAKWNLKEPECTTETAERI